MNLMDLAADLRQNSYPGRGIVVGKHADGEHAVLAYFIMGRSVNSRNRVFTMVGDEMKTETFDPSKMVDPSLIIYYPVRVWNDYTIVTNGDQTDTIYDFVKNGQSFEAALRTRTFEPDPDNYTPRISAILDRKTGNYKLSILKSAHNNPASTRRYFFEYESPLAGEAHFIHTYDCDGDPIPSFTGEPVAVSVDGSIDEFTSLLWNNLNEDNKVSLFVRYIDLKTGKTETRVVNKNQ
jgi:IMP cyclohydrolase